VAVHVTRETRSRYSSLWAREYVQHCVTDLEMNLILYVFYRLDGKIRIFATTQWDGPYRICS